MSFLLLLLLLQPLAANPPSTCGEDYFLLPRHDFCCQCCGSHNCYNNYCYCCCCCPDLALLLLLLLLLLQLQLQLRRRWRRQPGRLQRDSTERTSSSRTMNTITTKKITNTTQTTVTTTQARTKATFNADDAPASTAASIPFLHCYASLILATLLRNMIILIVVPYLLAIATFFHPLALGIQISQCM